MVCGVRVFVGYYCVYSLLMFKVWEVIGVGWLGCLVFIMGSVQFYKLVCYFEDGLWCCEVGGGFILINLIYEIGNFCSFCGEIVVV